MILLNTTAGSSRLFHDEVINSNFGELIICIFLLCGLWWGKKKSQSQSKSLALSCSWHTLAEDMSVEKCETIHKAPHAPTLKYYRETFKWKTSNKLQLRCLWHSALSWAPYHCSAYSSQYCFSREGKRKTSLVFLYFTDWSYEGKNHPKPPWWGIYGSEDDVTGTDVRLSSSLLNISAVVCPLAQPRCLQQLFEKSLFLPQTLGIC